MYGQRIKELREKYKLSQTELSKIIGVSQSSLGNYERESQKPDADTIAKVAAYFRVSADWLLGLSTSQINSDYPKRVGYEAFTENYFANLDSQIKEEMGAFLYDHSDQITNLLWDVYLFSLGVNDFRNVCEGKVPKKDLDKDSELLEKACMLIEQQRHTESKIISGESLLEYQLLKLTDQFTKMIRSFCKIERY